MLNFIRPCHHAMVTTTRRNGSPHSSLLSAGVDFVGRVVVAAYPERDR
jgi:hypothetical protein